jgi:DNA (cytosine-5)-methyltransferase 1
MTCNILAQNADLNSMSDYKPSYKWNLTDLEKVKKNNLKVFSCFACGGGSTMGYKLAGFDVIGANEIDPEMAWHYKTNHNPKYFYLEDIRKFRLRNDLPKELFELDVLDGSPPCSSFSMAGSREKGWGKKKVFREGQAEQVLDDLFFDFIELARKLKPKVVIAENVKGMLQGNAKGYVKQIIGLFNVIGYDVQLFLLNAASMGVPQKRERVFFVARRNDLNLDNLKLGFHESSIMLRDIQIELSDPIKGCYLQDWNRLKMGKPKKYINSSLVKKSDVHPTITAGYKGKASPMPEWDARWLSKIDLCKIGTYPQDYIFRAKPEYLIGMSVPPLMTYGVANQVYLQWFKPPRHRK